MTPQAVPSAKADPVKTALVKALVASPAPSGAPLQPAAPALPMLLPATAGKTQQIASAEIMQAYLALAESDAVSDVAPAIAAARRPGSDDDEAQRGLAVPLVKADDGGTARPASPPWLPLLAPGVSPLRRAAVVEAAAEQGQAASRPNDAARLENRQMSVGLMSLAAGLLAAAIVGFVLLVLR
ncbi:hypothetical protein B5V02_19865 [Mesorhizobium kowhaii]|uniref:Uncharacterized protein n=2 Tax=Mesorhizobium kowhaii TaxID=1300272 RepID=A0A2W7CKD7_9HYPH|nr:hypothetical protein B5V02_19865 [Mesorhizobium kowhaii]